MSGVGAERVFHSLAVLGRPNLGQPSQVEHRVCLIVGNGSGILILLPGRDHDLRQDDRIDHADDGVDITGDVGVPGQPVKGHRMAHERQSQQRQEDGGHDNYNEGAKPVHARERSAAAVGGQQESRSRRVDAKTARRRQADGQ